MSGIDERSLRRRKKREKERRSARPGKKEVSFLPRPTRLILA